MARIDWVEARLLNWARWRLTGRSSGRMGYAAVDLQAPASGQVDPWCGPSIPVSDVDASEVDDAVMRLPSELRVTVIEQYLGRGGERDKLARLCCSKATLHARIERAHRLLAEHWTAQRERREAERQRVMALQQAARP